MTAPDLASLENALGEAAMMVQSLRAAGEISAEAERQLLVTLGRSGVEVAPGLVVDARQAAREFAARRQVPDDRREQVVADAVGLIEATQAGISLITAERLRQIAVEGYTPEHDAEHAAGELAAAAAAYAAWAAGDDETARGLWPFGLLNYNPGRKQLDGLVKAGALVAAEIDRVVAEEARCG